MADKIRAVLVGCGGISRAWLRAAEGIDHLEIVGMVDLYEETAKTRAAEFNLDGVLISTDMQAALDQTKPDIVFNCTVPEAHLEVSERALRSGYHVLSEKPLADSMASAQALVKAAEESGKLFAVIQNRRYHDSIRRLSRFLKADSLGPLTTINSDFYIGAHFGGFRDHMEHVLLLDMAIHTFDAARMLANADPVAVYCKEWNPSGSWYDRDASAIAIFEFDNGIVYTYRGSWCAEGVRTTWECDWRIIGEQGTVTWDGAEDFQAQTVANKTDVLFYEYQDVEIPTFDPADKIGSHAGLIADFVDCVAEGRTPETTGADNIKSLAMVFGAIESAEKGQRVEIRW
ncbi:MAG: Gfo/Idh/MocA family oxidoreductase [Chloroflexota bacterium]